MSDLLITYGIAAGMFVILTGLLFGMRMKRNSNLSKDKLTELNGG
ncbi:MAG: hypothetical protein WB511_05225 [Nitrososphaeraceae archaeon]|jgi:hypothetical protein